MSGEGFFGRWSRRKEEARKEPGDAARVREAEVPAPATCAAPVPETTAPAGDDPAPTLEDTRALTPDSDFTRFTRPDVAPEVKNAALKKLFADPHFNRMDGLDVYIDDYSKPDPLPPAMLRQLAGAKFLKLFDDAGEEDSTRAKDPVPREAADAEAAGTVAQSQPVAPGDPAVPPPAAPHADPDLRLQQDDAAGPPGPRQGPR